MFQTEVAEKIKTHISCLTTFLPKMCRVRDVEKYGTAKQATHCNVALSGKYVHDLHAE